MADLFTELAWHKGDGGVIKSSTSGSSIHASFSFLSDSIFCTYPIDMLIRSMKVTGVDAKSAAFFEGVVDLHYTISQ